MSSVAVIVVIIVALCSLVCYAFISQTLAHKREQQERLIGALTIKARNFKFMLSGFPQGFLPPELTLLVQKSLLEIYNQLSELEGNNPSHKSELQTLSQQMSDARRRPTRRADVRMTSNQQIAEVKACLEELHKYIFQLEEKKRIQRENADSYRASIRELVVNITVDAYTIAGKQAIDKEKPRLALHSLDLALKLMQRERKSGNFDERIVELQQQCAELTKQISEQDIQGVDPLAGLDSNVQTELESQWSEFEQSSPAWKRNKFMTKPFNDQQ